MLKMLINEEEVVSNKDFTIKKEMLNTPSVILNNVYPKTWEEDKDYTSRFYHPNDYSKCKIVDETYIPPEEGTTVTSNTGEIYITDADNTKENDYKVQGKAEQHSYSGKNYANINKDPDWEYGNTVWERSGSNVTVKNNGTSTYAYVEYYIDNLKPNTTYTISFDTTISVGVCSIDVQKLRDGAVASNRLVRLDSATSGHVSGQFTTPSDTSAMCINLYSLRGTYHANAKTTYSNIQIEEGSSETSYEPYVGGTPSPNPDYPQEIKTVSGIGNLLDLSKSPIFNNNASATFNEPNIVITKTGSNANAFCLFIVGDASSLNGKTLKFTGNLVSGQGRAMIGYADFDGSNRVGIDGNVNFNTPKFTRTMTVDGTTYSTKKVVVWLYGDTSQAGTSGDTLTYSNVMVSETTSQYVPYGHWLPVKVSNKNLLDIPNNQIQLIKSSARAISIYPQNKVVLEAGTYTISFPDLVMQNNSRPLYVEPAGVRGSFVLADNKQTFTITEKKTLSYLYIFLSNNDNDNATATFTKIQLEKNTTVTPYIEHQEQTTLVDLNKYDENNNIVGNYEICSIGNIKELLTIKDGKAIINKDIEKLTFNGTETIQNSDGYNGLFQIKNIMTYPYKSILGMSNYFTNSLNMNITDNSSANNYLKDGQFAFRWNFSDSNRDRIYFKYLEMGTDVDAFKTWLSTHNTEVYYQLPATETITLRGTYDINLYEGVNHISIVDDDLIPVTTLHYNYVNEQTITDLLFCGVVKNSGNISLNPRYPHYSTLQILDFKNFLSEGELDAFVISNKTILEAIQMVIDSISSYGFVLGNINILNPNEIIGAYSTKDKSAYDVFSYIADITQSRWTTRVIDENTVAIDFYDPSLMEQGTTIEYTQEFFKNNLIDDMDYSYGTNDYRNKQIMTSNQVYSNISQSQSIVANGYQTQFQTEQPLGQIISITSDGKELTFATNNAKELGFTADFYYTPGNNYFESADLRATGEVLNIEYMAIVEGRQIITNPNEIQRVADSTNRKGIVTRYENRNDAITSNELQLIGQSYIKYKGTPEIVLKIKSRSNIWEVGQRVQFNAPIDELNTEYMVRSKEINHIATTDTIFYTYELTSSFNSETAINYFDNQRAKAKGNIGEGEYISRNVDVESTANIIFYDTQATEVTITGDNSLNSVLNAPFIN